MLDFSLLKRKELTLAELAADLTQDDLRDLTNEMIDEMLRIIADCRDAVVTFKPDDPGAFDGAALDPAEVHMPWTLGHVIAHATASSEESAFLAAELARGVPNHGRSRSEVPWREVTTLAQCRRRLEESRRMRLSSLGLWPDNPHLDIFYQPSPRAQPRNAITHFISGLAHDSSHLEQMKEIVRQAKVARGTTVTV